MNRKLYNEVIRFLTNNERVMVDLSKVQAHEKLDKTFKPRTNDDINSIFKAYDKWRRFYIDKDKPVKPMTETMSFRCTPEEKEEIKILLNGRNPKFILLEVLRNE